ncbi:hypothetical protein CHS0354_035003 [Potamilus streckersoni]|uniref:Carboxylesterase type B domain-containing protein n=1 Tax=Potamilus streckersoni TaxID=2493646 RepID=A0AAE0SET8_9BIVA|nr:hypothetical protein CHS0354_035003 [Potamilus streckersoni]
MELSREKYRFVALISCIQACIASVIIRQLGDKVVETKYGRVRGVLVEFDEDYQLKEIEAFFSIPYASLRGMRGNVLRFMPPSSPPKLKYLKDASKQNSSAACLHKRLTESVLHKFWRQAERLKKQDEDCLSVNLYVPNQDWNDTKLMPVMIFIHGESYEIGTGNAYDGSVLASYGGVIVVTVNYRLGVLGFLSTGDASAAGNYALLDLLAIFSWIKDNIGAFGGDKDRVTLFGHGYGAALVNIFLFSSMARDETYFQRVILQSGSALSSWAVSVNPALCTNRLARNVNCSGSIDNSDELINCLRSKSVEDLVENAPFAPKYYSCFAPNLNSQAFHSQSLRELMKDKKSRFSKTPIMFGITKDEAYSYLNEHEIKSGISKERKSQILRTFVQNIYRNHRQKIFDILDHEYASWDHVQDDASRRDNVVDLLTDALYMAPVIEMAQEHSRHGDTYLYVFSHSTSSENYPEWVKGAHGEELPYIFGAPLVDGISPFPQQYTSSEKILSQTMMRFWTNFAKTGDPNLPEDDTSSSTLRGRNRHEGATWPKYDTESQKYVTFAAGEGPSIRSHYRGKELALWMNLLPKIDVSDKDGNTPGTDELEHSTNMSTFDSSHRLVGSFDEIFPSPPPMPPTPPPNDKPVDTTGDEATIKLTNLHLSEYTLNPKRIETFSTTRKPESTVEESEAAKSKEETISTSSVPLSITVAVGCSFLFLNILILAGVFYQRKRIREMRGNGDSACTSGDKDVKHRYRDESTKDPDLQEMASLMQISPVDNDANIKIEKTNMQTASENQPVYKTITKALHPQHGEYTYNAVSTTSSSPMHRNYPPNNISKEGQLAQHRSLPSTRQGINSSIRPPGNDILHTSENEMSLPKPLTATSNNANTIV